MTETTDFRGTPVEEDSLVAFAVRDGNSAEMKVMYVEKIYLHKPRHGPELYKARCWGYSWVWDSSERRSIKKLKHRTVERFDNMLVLDDGDNSWQRDFYLEVRRHIYPSACQ